MTTSQVSALNIYPIKSCGGVALAHAHVERRGLEFDRRFMLIDTDGRFLTQRQLPAMALLRTQIESEKLCVSRPDGATLNVPLRPEFAATTQVSIWRSQLDACVADASVSEWFSEFLERPVRLVYMAEDQHRRVSSARATRTDDEVSFADGAPILLISEGSLAELNARLSEPVSMQRFRPNIVVDSEQPFIEDSWREIQIGEAKLEVAWSCARCTMTTVNPDTGVTERNREPLRTLREFRRDGGNVVFGQNLLVRGTGVIRVGDPVRLVE